MCFRGTQKKHFFPLAPNPCRVPTSARLRTCRGFAMLLCKLGGGEAGRVAYSPSHPTTPVPPLLMAPSPPHHPSRPLVKVTYGSAFSFLGAEIWVGWEGEEVCAGGIAGPPPEGKAGAPRASLRRLPVLERPPALRHCPRPLPLWAAAGHSRRRALPCKFPLGIRSPRGRAPDLPGAPNLRCGKPGSSAEFSRRKAFSGIFPRFLIIF